MIQRNLQHTLQERPEQKRQQRLEQKHQQELEQKHQQNLLQQNPPQDLPQKLQQNRRQVSIRSSDWLTASRLRTEVSMATGAKVSITDIIARAVRCLDEKLVRGRPYRSVAVSNEQLQRENLRMEVVSALSQFIARTMPERRLRGVTFDPDEGSGGVVTLFVQLDDIKIPLFVGRVLKLASVVQGRVDSEPVTSNDE